MAAKTKPEGRPVLVTTAHRGVFFGYADKKGFLGLAATGPVKGCRVGPPADIELHNVTCVAEVTPEAVERWESAPW